MSKTSWGPIIPISTEPIAPSARLSIHSAERAGFVGNGEPLVKINNSTFLGPAHRDDDEDDPEVWIRKAKAQLSMLGSPEDEMAAHQRMEEASSYLMKASKLARAKLAKQLHTSGMVRFA